MTSFFSDSFNYFSNHPGSVCAFLSSTRPIFNSSIIPVTMSSPELWYALCLPRRLRLVIEDKTNRFLQIFIHSHTLQFSPSIRTHFEWPSRRDESRSTYQLQPPCASCKDFALILRDLYQHKRYACRTTKHFSTCDPAVLDLICSRSTGLQTLEYFCHGQMTHGTLDNGMINESSILVKHIGKLKKLKIAKLDPRLESDLKHLSACVSLTDLDLSENGITGECLEHFGNLKSLECLNLCCTLLTDQGLGGLPSLPSLLRLGISRGSSKLSIARGSAWFSDIGFSSIAKQKKLQSFKMGYNSRVTSEGLRTALGDLEDLTELKLIGCWLDDARQFSDSYLGVLETIKGSLSSLWLSGNRIITDDAVVRLLYQQNCLETLDLSSCQNLGTPTINAISKIGSMKTLGMANRSLTAEACRSLEALQCLDLTVGSVLFSENVPNTVDYVALGEMKNLNSLTIRGKTVLNDNFINALASSTSLTEVEFNRGDESWRQESVHRLFKMPRLRKLTISHLEKNTESFRIHEKVTRVFYSGSDLMDDLETTFRRIVEESERRDRSTMLLLEAAPFFEFMQQQSHEVDLDLECSF